MKALRVYNSFGARTRAKHIVPVFPGVTDMQQVIGAGSTLNMYLKKEHPDDYSGKPCTTGFIVHVWCSQSANEKQINGAGCMSCNFCCMWGTTLGLLCPLSWQ